MSLVNPAKQFDARNCERRCSEPLKPSIGPMRSLTPRWSCPIRLCRLDSALWFDQNR